MARVIFFLATLLGLAVGTWLMRQVVLTRRAARRHGGPEAFLAEAQWRQELVRLAEQVAFVALSLNSLTAGTAPLPRMQLKAALFIIIGQSLLTVNSWLALRARGTFRARYEATTLSLQQQLDAMTFERDQLRDLLAAMWRPEPDE